MALPQGQPKKSITSLPPTRKTGNRQDHGMIDEVQGGTKPAVRLADRKPIALANQPGDRSWMSQSNFIR